MPEALAYLWEWFGDIAPSLGMGAGLFQEIDAYCRLTGVEMGAWDAAMLRVIFGAQQAAGAVKDERNATTGSGVVALMRGMQAKR